MNTQTEKHLVQQTTLFYEGKVLRALESAISKKFLTEKFIPNSMPAFPALKVIATSNSAKKKMRPCLEKIVSEFDFFELDLKNFAASNTIILRVKREKKQQASIFLMKYADTSLETSTMQEMSEAIPTEMSMENDAKTVAAHTTPPVNKKSWLELLEKSKILRGVVYQSLNYPRAAQSKSKIKGGLTVLVSLPTEELAVTFSIFLEHVGCQEIRIGKSRKTVYAVLVPGVDYMERFDDKCLEFFPSDSQRPEVTATAPVTQIATSPTLVAAIALFNGFTPAEQELFMQSIVVKNKKTTITKEAVEAELIKKLIAKFAEQKYLIMGLEEKVDNSFTFNKKVIQIKHTFVRVPEKEAFHLN